MSKFEDETPQNNKKNGNFYDIDFDYHEPPKPQNPESPHEANEVEPKSQTSSHIDRSIRRLQSLFTQAVDSQSPHQNPYKKNDQMDFYEREKNRDKMAQMPLPTREQIRAERERRRRLRIEELENITDASEVERTFHERNRNENDSLYAGPTVNFPNEEIADSKIDNFSDINPVHNDQLNEKSNAASGRQSKYTHKESHQEDATYHDTNSYNEALMVDDNSHQMDSIQPPDEEALANPPILDSLTPSKVNTTGKQHRENDVQSGDNVDGTSSKKIDYSSEEHLTIQPDNLSKNSKSDSSIDDKQNNKVSASNVFPDNNVDHEEVSSSTILSNEYSESKDSRYSAQSNVTIDNISPTGDASFLSKSASNIVDSTSTKADTMAKAVKDDSEIDKDDSGINKADSENDNTESEIDKSDSETMKADAESDKADVESDYSNSGAKDHADGPTVPLIMDDHTEKETENQSTSKKQVHSEHINDDTDNFDEVVVASSVTQNKAKKIKTNKHNKKKRKSKKENDIYSLSNLSTKEKVIFGFNVLFDVLKRFAIYILLIGLLMGALAGGIGLGYFANLVSKTPPPSKEEMAEQINRVEQQSTLYYANGNPIANVRADVVRNVTQLSDISQYIVDGLVSTEDEYFYEHPGIVPKAILRATLQELLLSGSGTGGSTLTQQLVKQQMLTNDVTFFRKANEILLALRVENYFSKDEILTAYLNISPFGRNNNGENVAGILSASKGVFGKSPNEVNLAQAAFLVGLPQDPYNYTPYNQYGEINEDQTAGIERMKEVLFRMYRAQKITKEEYEQAIQYDITKDFIPTEQKSVKRQTYLYQSMMNGAIEQIMRLNIADQGLTWNQVNGDVDWYNEFYFEALEQLRTGGYHVYTTINKDIYDSLQTLAAKYKDQLGVSYDGVYTDPDSGEETYYVETVQAGIVVMENKTGKVLGFVAGTDYENNQIDHAFGMRRSPGSTIKPLAVYGPAVENNLINPSTVIPDTAFEITFEDGSTWTPTNYGGVVSGGLMTARTALLKSDNLPAVRIYQKLIENNIPIFDYMKKMGFDINDSYTKEDTENLAFSLGGVTTGPTVFEQTRAFTTFANNGQYIDGYFIDRIEDAYGNVIYQHDVEPVKVFSEDTNYILVDMLRDTNTEGTGRTAAAHMQMGGDWIAKSGISENSRDIWYLASTPKITTGTWLGYDNRYYDYYIDINDGYGRESERIQIYWANIMNELYAQYPDIFGTEETFVMPDSVKETEVLKETGTLPGSITVNGTNIKVTQPLVKEIFKTSRPAPELKYEFIFNGTEQDAQNFWASHIAKVQEAARKRREAQQRNNSQTTTTESSETTTEGEPPNENGTPAPETQPESTEPPASTTVAPG
ncbi:transglycosylase domain-containing protein [Globicatella sulfidifaciens]